MVVQPAEMIEFSMDVVAFFSESLFSANFCAANYFLALIDLNENH